jgi:hypothetical protein
MSFVVVKMGYHILSPFYETQKISRPVILVLVAGSFLSGWLYKKRIGQLDDMPTFEDKVAKHEKLYRARILWLAINCCSACFLYVLTTHIIFLYLSLFEFVIYLLAFPNKIVIQKELKNDEIIFL